MGQNDFTIANADGATVRADINSALQALAGQSSGASAPGTTLAYQMWADTTNGVFKVRNAANSGWIIKDSTTGTRHLSKTANYTVALSDGWTVINCSSSGGAFTITLPAAATASSGFAVTVRKTDSSANAVTIDGDGSETINGATTLTLTQQYETVALFCDGSNWHIVSYSCRSSTQSVWIPAGAMTPRTTNGAASGAVETSTNKVMLSTLDFDASTAEYAQFFVAFPKSWDLGTVTFRAIWKHAATTTNFGVVFGLQGVALSNDDAADTAFGTAQTVTDTGGTTNDIYVSDVSAAITIAGTPALADWVVFQLYRAVSDGSDTMAIDAGLLGILMTYSTTTATDA